MRLRHMLLWLLLGPAAFAQTTQPAGEVQLTLVSEGKEKMLQATVTRGGKPVEGAKVSFGVQRTFGKMQLGADTTLDDGTAQVAFPVKLMAMPGKKLEISASVTSPADLAGLAASGSYAPAAGAPPAEIFPRALWAPRAPLSLIGTIVVVLAAVWITYVYAVVQLVRIKRTR